MQAVERVERAAKAPKNKVVKERGGLPTFFRALCATASAGGESGYVGAGYELARHLSDHMGYELDEDETQAQLSALNEALRTGADDKVIVSWFKENLPRCMDLVPTRRHRMFVNGVRACRIVASLKTR